MPTADDVYQALNGVMDPELGLPITDMGLVYDVQVSGNRADIKLTLTTMGCPMSGTITELARRAVLEVEGIDEASVELVWDPPWSVDMMSDEARMRLGMF
ncbi:metal-sulfur cluster assembly factor [bacterium]|nr:metal-sulfur cluster assembly factor [bacterium]MBU1983354.1 metal-sulfur cluster assembly factor [bacterium]